mmetsp:Transcript_12246/g.51244  ORF Transcript_12246/g.51244 Transcript_12246/m.51244 type:complete len:238 (-) Transcript_12246:884-1597(-)
MPPTKHDRWSISCTGPPPSHDATNASSSFPSMTRFSRMPRATFCHASCQPRIASVRPPCTHTLSRYSYQLSPIAPTETLVFVHTALVLSKYRGYRPFGTFLGRFFSSDFPIATFTGVSPSTRHFSSLGVTLSESAPNSIASDPNSESTTTPGAPVHGGVFVSPVFRLTMFLGTPVGVRNAGSSRFASSRHFSTYISSPERSYAARRPPKTLMVVSNTEASHSRSKYKNSSTQFRARE